MGYDHDPHPYRAALREALYPALTARDEITALWEGGSAARDAMDAHSDIDICALVDAEDGGFEATWEAFEAALTSHATIAHRWSRVGGIFKGMEQRLYILEDAPPYFMLDVVLFPSSQPIPILERERHGEPVVILDRAGVLRTRALDQIEHTARLQRSCQQAQDAFAIYALLARKESARGRSLDAHGFYKACLGLLHTMLGAARRPDIYDFGGRYWYDVLSEEETKRLEALTFPAKDGIEAALDDMRAWIDELSGEVSS